MPETSNSKTTRLPHNPVFEWSWIAPKYWLLWFWLGLLWVITRMPVPFVFAVGRALGRLMYLIMKQRRHIVEVNLKLCLPELSDTERENLAKENFEQFGITVFESGWVWWSDPLKLKKRVRLENLAPCKKILNDGKPVIIIGLHTAALELAYSQLSLEIPCNILFRVNSNPVWEYAANCGRRRYPINLLPRKQVKNMLANLKKGEAGLMVTDHDMGKKHSVFAPYFGISAATVTTAPDLATQVGAKVLFCQAFRDGTKYVVRLSDPFENYPSGDLQADAEKQNEVFEQAAREHPEQYMWMHRRFKSRPDGENKVY